MAFWDYLCVCIKLLSQNMSKCLRSVFEVLCNLVGLLEARKNLVLWIILSLPPHTRANPTVSSRDWLRSKSQKLISLTFTSFPSSQGSKQAIQAKTDQLLRFLFSHLFFQLFWKIIAISYKILLKKFFVMLLTPRCVCLWSHLHAHVISRKAEMF